MKIADFLLTAALVVSAIVYAIALIVYGLVAIGLPLAAIYVVVHFIAKFW